MMSLVRARLGEPKTRYKLIGVDDAEGPPVPIPNTEVKLSGAENSALATRCENREMPILVASFPISNEADFYSRLFYFANYTFFIPPSGVFIEEIDENAPFVVLIVDKNGEYHVARIRRLTPRECWRLQGFTDEQFDRAAAAGISDNQLYKI